MNIRAMILAGLLGSTMLAGTAFAADLSNLPLAAKQGDRAAVQFLSGRIREPRPGPLGKP
jgi:hypothetical protein